MKAVLAGVLGINHHSPLIYCEAPRREADRAGNQSPLPFDILAVHGARPGVGWESITTPL